MIHKVDQVLFTSSMGESVSYNDFVKALKEVGADQECDVLFVHTELSFGQKTKGVKRKELVQYLYDAIRELGIKTLVFPTFTFSFGNKEIYSVNESKTSMGMMNEFVRKLPEAKRTMDPMMSVCIIGENESLLNVNCEESLGKGGIFDLLHHTNRVKFLFLGAKVSRCITFMHYVEKQLEVPYRYDMEFTGQVMDQEGHVKDVRASLFVKYRDIVLVEALAYEQHLIDKGIEKKVTLGDSSIACVNEAEVYKETISLLENDVNYFLGEAYDTKPFVKEYTYGNVTTL